MGDHRLHRLALGDRRACLYQPRRRQVRSGSDRSEEWNQELRLRTCRALSDHRANHGAGTRVPSARDRCHRSSDLRFGQHRAARSMARQDRGENGKERAVASRAAGRRGAREWRTCRRGRWCDRRRIAGEPVWRRSSHANRRWTGAAARRRRAGPVCRSGTRASRPSEFSDAVSIQTPSVALTGARKPYFIFGDAQDSVDLWFFDLARTDPLQFTGKGSADIAPNDTGDITGVASYDQGEWSVIFKRPLRATSGAPFTPGEFTPIAFSVWDGFSRERGSRRGLTVWESLYVEPEVVPSAFGPMLRTALVILVIELLIIGWVRRSHGSRARTELGGEPMQPSTTR